MVSRLVWGGGDGEASSWFEIAGFVQMFILLFFLEEEHEGGASLRSGNVSVFSKGKIVSCRKIVVLF